uniref:Uncharacterized protein n=1 Tax=Mustela putorius furo TaxID=9669 RepID=M3YMD7_MUSPF
FVAIVDTFLPLFLLFFFFLSFFSFFLLFFFSSSSSFSFFLASTGPETCCGIRCALSVADVSTFCCLFPSSRIRTGINEKDGGRKVEEREKEKEKKKERERKRGRKDGRNTEKGNFAAPLSYSKCRVPYGEISYMVSYLCLLYGKAYPLCPL